METTTNTTTQTPYRVLTDNDYRVLGPMDFGADGLIAIESIGPFVRTQAVGPLVMVHDAQIEAHRGIGHHPHKYNERLFYIMEGQLDHDDSRNSIQGHMDEGDVGLFTEGWRGMVHSEWNNGDAPAHAYILVYATDPMPDVTAFTRLRAPDAPVYDEGAGVRTKELVGARSSLEVNGDLRLFTDSTLTAGSALTVALGDGEGGLVSVQEGAVTLDGTSIEHGATIVLPPDDAARGIVLTAETPARLLRAVFGTGLGYVVGKPRL